MKLTYSILFLFLSYSLIAQEYKSFKVYKKITGNKIVANGVWLKKDRKKQTRVWSDANLFNLNTENGFTKYTSISQFRDYHAWFDKERKKRGHEIKWIGISVIAANQILI